MGKQLDSLTPKLKRFIARQHIFFVATAMREGRINLSPKGMDTFRVIDENKIIWLNLTGSGNETATHVHYSKRMTIMFCAFEDKPLILRLYGKAKVYHERDSKFQHYIGLFNDTVGARQIFELDIDCVQTSCGFAVPLMNFVKERSQLREWSTKKGPDGLKNYQKEKNSISLDGHNSNL